MNSEWPIWISIAFFGAIGAILRALISKLPTFWNLPIGTLLVNIIGSFLLGFIAAYSIKQQWAPEWRIGLSTGLMGALTTFSTFSLENAKYLEQGEWKTLVLNIVLQVIFGIALAYLGWILGGREHSVSI